MIRVGCENIIGSDSVQVEITGMTGAHASKINGIYVSAVDRIRRESVPQSSIGAGAEAAAVGGGMQSKCIHISGATGGKASLVNGIYDQTDEISCGQPVYIKRNDATMCIHFWDKTGHWIVGTKTANKSLEDKGHASLPHRGSIDSASSLNTWSVFASSSWAVQPDVRCVCGVGNFEGGLKKIDGDVWMEYHAGKFAVCDAEDRRGGKGYIFCDADPESFPDMPADEVIDFRLFRTPWLAQRPWYSKVQVPKHSLQDYRSYYSKRCARCNM